MAHFSAGPLAPHTSSLASRTIPPVEVIDAGRCETLAAIAVDPRRPGLARAKMKFTGDGLGERSLGPLLCPMPRQPSPLSPRTRVPRSGLCDSFAAAKRPVARQAGGLAGALCRPGSQWRSLLWIVWTAWTAPCCSPALWAGCFPVLRNRSPPMHAPERWPYGEIESWWAWRDHLDRVQDPNIATLKREADCEIARILRCCESRWEPKRPRLVPGRVGTGSRG